MKKVLVALSALLAMQAQAQPKDWENPFVLGINKLPYHATLQLPSKQKECKEIIKSRRMLEVPLEQRPRLTTCGL